MKGWIAVDLDGTLAEYDEWRGPQHIGRPIMPMVRRVEGWLLARIEVRIFTARVGGLEADNESARPVIQQWCRDVFGVELPVTATKDYGMIELWDDRCVQVVTNTGRTLAEEYEAERLARAGAP